MTKRFFCLLLVLAGLLTNLECVASGHRLTIPLQRYVGIVIDRGPGPIRLTKPMELFSAFQDVDEIIVTSDGFTGVVTVSIYNTAGVVVETVTDSAIEGSEISLSITDLSSGTYILVITIGDTSYVGEFEI